MEELNKKIEMEALVCERDAWISTNYYNIINDDDPFYDEEDFLDMAVAFRQLNGEVIDLE